MMPAVRERSLPFDAQVRLHPEDAAALAFQALKLQLDADIFRQYVRESVRRVNDPAFPRGDGHISCLAGNCSFFINWQGRLFPCVMLSELSAPVFDLGFLAAWETVSAKPGIFRLAQNAGNAVSGRSAAPAQLLPFRDRFVSGRA